MIQLFEQRDFGNKINATFQYITQNINSFILSIIYIAGPPVLLMIVAGSFLISDVFSKFGSGSNVNPLWFMNDLPAIFIIGIGFMLSLLAVSLTTFAHLKVYNRNAGQPIQVSQVWDEAKEHIGPAIVFNILSTIVTIVASVFLFIPGIYVGVVLSLGLPVLVFENTNFGQTWNRCFELIRDKWWSTFGLALVMGILAGLLRLVFQIPGMLIGFLSNDVATQGIVAIISGAISMLGALLLNSLVYLAIGFQYTNLVERQEGRGMISAIDSIGTQPTQARETDEGSF
jgi:MFS family permease